MPFLEYIVSCFLVASVALVLGEITISLAYRINRGYLRKLNQEVREYQRLSEEASVVADSETYRIINREGNEAFGRLFFYKIALSAASLWPIFFALQWLQDRYGSREPLIPGTSLEANYFVCFLICYIGARVLLGKLKNKIPYFRQVKEMLDEDQEEKEEFQPQVRNKM
jgi:hypothetical protein